MKISTRLLRRLVFAGIVAAFAALPQAAGAITTTFAGTFTSLNATRAVSVGGSAPSTCSSTPSPGAYPFGPFRYAAYNFGSLYGSQCVNVTVNSATAAGVFVTAYAVGTDYVNSPTSVIGTSGDCLPSGGLTTFSFTSPANGFVLVVEECNSGTGGTYTVTVNAGTVAARLFGTPSATRVGGATTVRWRTASEIGTVAYNVYREVNGHRVRVNVRPIAAGRRTYSFVDRHARRGALVRYWIQAVQADGSRTWLGHTRVVRT